MCKLLQIGQKNPWKFRFIVLESVVGFGELYPFRDINPPNNQFCFSKFFPKFFSVWAIEKDNKFFYSSKQIFSEFCFLFRLLNWENFVENNSGKQDSWFGSCMSRIDYKILDLLSKLRLIVALDSPRSFRAVTLYFPASSTVTFFNSKVQSTVYWSSSFVTT